jgi:hypothetical protein
MAVRFRHHYLAVTECAERPKAVAVSKKPTASQKPPHPKHQWMKNFHLTHPDKAAFSTIPPSSGIRGAKLIR